MATIEEKLRDFVRLYRLCEKPSIVEDSFSFQTDKAGNNLLQALHDFLVHSEFDITGLVSGGNPVLIPFKVSDYLNQPLSFNCQIPSQGFYETFEMFVDNTPSLHKGDIPALFYIKDCDYFHGQGETASDFHRIDRTCRLINYLEKIITHSETKTNHIRFVLLTHDKDTQSARKQIFESRFQYSDTRKLSELEQIEQIVEEKDLHHNERIAIFRNTLAEFLEKESDPEKRFTYILKNFKELKEQYDLNYETYINKFAFDKFELEVVNKSDELMQKLNTTLNDIVTKVLVVPAGVLALKALGGKNSISTDLILIFAILAISVVLSLLVKHQFSNLNQIEKNIDSIFRNFRTGATKANQTAQDNKKLLIQKKNFIYNSLWVFLAVVWLPFLFCVILSLKAHSFEAIWNEFSSWFTILFMRCCESLQDDPNRLGGL